MTLVGLPQSVLVPPQGPAFCGSPRSFSTIHETGSRSLKWPYAAAGTTAISTANARRNLAECFMDMFSFGALTARALSVFFETPALAYASLAVLTHVLGAGVAGQAVGEAVCARCHTARASWPA